MKIEGDPLNTMEEVVEVVFNRENRGGSTWSVTSMCAQAEPRVRSMTAQRLSQTCTSSKVVLITG